MSQQAHKKYVVLSVHVAELDTKSQNTMQDEMVQVTIPRRNTYTVHDIVNIVTFTSVNNL